MLEQCTQSLKPFIVALPRLRAWHAGMQKVMGDLQPCAPAVMQV